MYVEKTESKSGEPRFAIHDLNISESELLAHGLIELKSRALQDAETFKQQRASCIEMFQKIDRELTNAR